ncbi:MAG: DEAD/DEAH box helicase [Anaerolineae bacterium]|nr:DEAD/DEAH box helicase [Anaerolineae bacterium]
MSKRSKKRKIGPSPQERPKHPHHPFGASQAQLMAWRESCIPHLKASPSGAIVFLPGSADMPHPSIDWQETGLQHHPLSEAPELYHWHVFGLALPLSAAVEFLLTPNKSLGRDLLFWRMAILESLAFIAGQQILPGLVRDGMFLRADWLIASEAAERMEALAQQMPPFCRAYATSEELLPSANHIMNEFTHAMARMIVRSAASQLRLPGGRSHGQIWLYALTTSDTRLKLPPNQVEDFYTTWQTWSQQNDAAGNRHFRIALRLNPPEGDDQEWTLEYLLQSVENPALMITAAQVWRGQNDILRQRFDQAQERLLRGLAFAGRLFPPILESLRDKTPQQAVFDTAQAAAFLQEAVPYLQAIGYRVLLPESWSSKKTRLCATARIKPRNGKGLLNLSSIVDFEYEISLGGEIIEQEEFMRLAALKQPLVRVRGQWVLLDAEQAAAALNIILHGRGQMSFVDALRLGLDGGEAHGLSVEKVEAEGWLSNLFVSLRNPEVIVLPRPPQGLRADMRPYQVRGFAWLLFLRRFGLGACLADDMGLGKTLQAIAYLQQLKNDNAKIAPALVVCPTSVVGNWLRELQRFAPGLRAVIHQGAGRSSGEDFARLAQSADVVLTSYPLLARDQDSIVPIQWSAVILDEAQNIKNSSTKQAQAAHELKAEHRIAMTGTPIENRLSELWSIFHFINPNYLGSERSFRQNFASPIERADDVHAAQRLKRLTAPFILRRLKTDPTIISDLPEKLEMIVHVNLTQEQATLYEAVVRQSLELIKEAEEKGNAMSRRGLVLSLLTQLKQVCNHPAHFMKDGSPLAGRSGKLERLTEMLEEVFAEGDKALVFTQFAEMGELLCQHLEASLGEKPLWLHGGTKVEEREDLIRRFQAPYGPRLFILSLKVGGVGLNLTQANHVFHFDRWWNPAVENQATDRAYRIGQMRRVQVHKFVAIGTLEERIDAMIESKKALAERIVSVDESWLTELSTDDLHELVALRPS